jgi:hypothetical protein
VEQVRVDLQSLPDNRGALSAVSYESIAALTTEEQRTAATALVDAEEAAVQAITDALADVAGVDVADDVEPLARQFLAAVVDELGPPRTQEDADTSDSNPEGDGESGSASSQGGDGESGSASSRGGDGESGSASSRGGDGESGSASSRGGDGESGSASSRDGDVRASTTQDAGIPGETGEGEIEATQPGRDGTPQGDVPAMRTTSASDSEYVVKFFDSGRSVAAVGNPRLDSALQQAVEYLLKERGLGRRLQFPYTPGSSDTALLHREPEHPDGRSMDEYANLGGLYLYTGQASATKRKRLETLAERAGLRVMFSGDWE